MSRTPWLIGSREVCNRLTQFLLQEKLVFTGFAPKHLARRPRAGPPGQRRFKWSRGHSMQYIYIKVTSEKIYFSRFSVKWTGGSFEVISTSTFSESVRHWSQSQSRQGRLLLLPHLPISPVRAPANPCPTPAPRLTRAHVPARRLSDELHRPVRRAKSSMTSSALSLDYALAHPRPRLIK